MHALHYSTSKCIQKTKLSINLCLNICMGPMWDLSIVGYHIPARFHGYACDCTWCASDLTTEYYNNATLGTNYPHHSWWQAFPFTVRCMWIKGSYVVTFQWYIRRIMAFHQKATGMSCDFCMAIDNCVQNYRQVLFLSLGPCATLIELTL